MDRQNELLAAVPYGTNESRTYPALPLPAGSSPLGYKEIVERRRALRIPGYETLADVGFDGPWVTPYQISSRAADGPVLVAYNWLDAPSVRQHRAVLEGKGYLPGIPFNAVLDLALAQLGRTRADLYITQAFHLLPSTRSGSIPPAHVDQSFKAVTQHELKGRAVIALGSAAALACQRNNVPHLAVAHPSARGKSFQERAEGLAAALSTQGL